jgi:hypothetical protein
MRREQKTEGIRDQASGNGDKTVTRGTTMTTTKWLPGLALVIVAGLVGVGVGATLPRPDDPATCRMAAELAVSMASDRTVTWNFDADKAVLWPVFNMACYDYSSNVRVIAGAAQQVKANMQIEVEATGNRKLVFLKHYYSTATLDMSKY